MPLKRRIKDDEFIVQLQHGIHFFKIGVGYHTTASQSNTLRDCARLITISKFSN